MRDNVSPEERLLKLIKGEKKQPPAEIIPPPAQRKPDLKDLLNSTSSLISAYLTPSHIRKLIFAAIGVSFMYLLISFLYPWFAFKKISLPVIKPEDAGELKFELKEEPKPYEFYAQGLNRQIFTNSSAPQASGAAAVVSADLIKDINLVGIISGENPQAVIEDKRAQRTYYLTKGQFIGELQIEDIQEGKIILNYRGQRYELYL